MSWIKFKDRRPESGTKVKVRFGNGKELEGKVLGDFISYPPEEMDVSTLMSKEEEWLDDND